MVNWMEEAGEVLEPTLTIREIVIVPLSGLAMTTLVSVVASEAPPAVTVHCACALESMPLAEDLSHSMVSSSLSAL